MWKDRGKIYYQIKQNRQVKSKDAFNHTMSLNVPIFFAYCVSFLVLEPQTVWDNSQWLRVFLNYLLFPGTRGMDAFSYLGHFPSKTLYGRKLSNDS